MRPGGKANDPHDSNPWGWGHEIARAFERGDSGAVYRHLEEMLAPIDADWKAHPPSPVPLMMC